MKIKRRYLTLIEVMIVIVLIGLIGGVIAYNMRGSLQEGRMFKTQQGGAQVYNILVLETARGASLEEIPSKWQDMVRNSTLANKPDQLLQDGWGKEYLVSFEDGELRVQSPRYTTLYNEKHGTTGPQYLN